MFTHLGPYSEEAALLFAFLATATPSFTSRVIMAESSRMVPARYSPASATFQVRWRFLHERAWFPSGGVKPAAPVVWPVASHMLVFFVRTIILFLLCLCSYDSSCITKLMAIED